MTPMRSATVSRERAERDDAEARARWNIPLSGHAAGSGEPPVRHPRRTITGTLAVPFQLPDDSVLAVDDDGNGLIRLALEIRERKTRIVRTVEFDFPTLGDWDQYQRDCAEVFQILAVGVPDLWIPESMEKARQDPQGYRDWAAVMSVSCRQSSVAGRLLDIVTTYLDPMMQDDVGCDGSTWVKQHMTPGQAVEMLALILLVEEMIQKKTKYSLIRVFRLVTALPSSPSSPTPPTPASTGRFVGPSPARAFSSGAQPSDPPQ